MRLNGKVALVSGAASGMGQSEALIFAREGARVVVADAARRRRRPLLGLAAGVPTTWKDIASGLDWRAHVSR
jgi:NAD(P)-dependent dehydrogenase (short-subunit alcohol dehydrogenase family)